MNLEQAAIAMFSTMRAAAFTKLRRRKSKSAMILFPVGEVLALLDALEVESPGTIATLEFLLYQRESTFHKTH